MNVTEIRNQVKQCIDDLSPEKLKVAADFLSSLAQQESEKGTEELLKIDRFKETLETGITSVNQLEIRKSLINTLQGKYAHAPTSSEDFAQKKQKEIEWEDGNK